MTHSFCAKFYDLSSFCSFLLGFFLNTFEFLFFAGLVMISSLMIITSLAMLAFPKQLRGNRIPAPHQVDSIDVHKPVTKMEQPEEESVPQLKGCIPTSH